MSCPFNNGCPRGQRFHYFNAGTIGIEDIRASRQTASCLHRNGRIQLNH